MVFETTRPLGNLSGDVDACRQIVVGKIGRQLDEDRLVPRVGVLNGLEYRRQFRCLLKIAQAGRVGRRDVDDEVIAVFGQQTESLGVRLGGRPSADTPLFKPRLMPKWNATGMRIRRQAQRDGPRAFGIEAQTVQDRALFDEPE